MTDIPKLVSIYKKEQSWHYLFSISLFAVALLVRFYFDYLLAPGFPFLTFFPAVIIASFVGGWRQGALVAVLSVVASWYFFLAPAYSFILTGTSIIALVFFTFILSLDICLIHYMQAFAARLTQERERSRALAASREVMFTELQHRVSNNLALISAILNMQKRQVSDGQARHALTEASERIQLIAKIQRQLHNPDQHDLSFRDFLPGLTRDLLEAGNASHIEADIRAEDISLPMETAMPVLLIAAELISNAVEHAHAGDRQGTLQVRFQRQNGMIVLDVQDNGLGFPEGFSIDTASSLGLKIIKSLSAQVGGTITFTNENGALCRLVFPEPVMQG